MVKLLFLFYKCNIINNKDFLYNVILVIIYEILKYMYGN